MDEIISSVDFEAKRQRALAELEFISKDPDKIMAAEMRFKHAQLLERAVGILRESKCTGPRDSLSLQ